MSKITTWFIMNLNDVSYSQLFLGLSDIISSAELIEEAEDVVIKLASDNLMRVLPEVVKLQPYSGRQDLTEEKAIANRARLDYGILIKRQLKAKLYSEDEKDNARLTLHWINDKAPKFPYYPQDQLTRIIGMMAGDLETKQDVVESIRGLNMIEYFVKLIGANDEFRNLSRENNQLFSTKNLPVAQKREIRKESYKALIRLINAFEWAIERKVENIKDYEDLYFQIRKIIVDAHFAYKMQIKKKATDNPDENDEMVVDEVVTVGEDNPEPVETE